MATKSPRVTVVLEEPLYRWLRRTARTRCVSISCRLRDLVREAFELHEDRYWVKKAEARLRTFDRKRALRHGRVWG